MTGLSWRWQGCLAWLVAAATWLLGCEGFAEAGPLYVCIRMLRGSPSSPTVLNRCLLLSGAVRP